MSSILEGVLMNLSESGEEIPEVRRVKAMACEKRYAPRTGRCLGGNDNE